MGNNEMMPGVDGTLNIVPDHPAAPATCGHRARIGIAQRDLLVLGLHHQSVQTVQALYFLTQRRNLLVEPRDLGLRYACPLAVGAVERREIPGYALVNLLQPPLHLGLRKVPVSRVDGFELAAIDRNARLVKQLQAPAQHHKLTADLADRRRRPIMGWSGPCFCPTNDGCCESAVLRALDVAFGSTTDLTALKPNFRFTPRKQTQIGHRTMSGSCPIGDIFRCSVTWQSCC